MNSNEIDSIEDEVKSFQMNQIKWNRVSEASEMKFAWLKSNKINQVKMNREKEIKWNQLKSIETKSNQMKLIQLNRNNNWIE